MNVSSLFVTRKNYTLCNSHNALQDTLKYIWCIFLRLTVDLVSVETSGVAVGVGVDSSGVTVGTGVVLGTSVVVPKKKHKNFVL